MKKILKLSKPNIIVCIGDLLDFSYISHFTELGEAEGKRLVEDVDIFKNELSYYKKYAKEEVIFLQGNHEDRLNRLLLKNPVLMGLVDLRDTCEKLGIKYVPTNEQPYKLLNDLYITHGLCYNKHFTSKLADTAGMSIISGHTHRTQSFVNSYPDGRIIKSFGLGSLTDTIEYYEKGKRLTGHSNSFGELLIDEDYWQFNTVMIENGKCILDGKLFTLEEASV